MEIIYQDNIEVLKKMEDSSIDIIITSPPYNLGNKNSGNVRIDSYIDKIPLDNYEMQQIKFLNECLRVLKPKGAMFYNHKNRYSKNKVITPWKWILQCGFNVKQEIIWNRLTTVDREASKFAPLDEKIFWLYKKSTFRLKRGAQNFTNIWSISRPTKYENKGHKATFPYQLIYRILNSLDIDKNVTVLDPYLGTGTTLQVCHNLKIKNGIGIEIDIKWYDVIKDKIKAEHSFKEKIPEIKKAYKKKELIW